VEFSAMRVLSYILILAGLCLFASAANDEYRGTTTKPAAWFGQGTGRSFNTHYLYSIPVLRNQNPELFHQFMVTHWIYGGVVVCAGLFLCLKDRRDKAL
jgi:hypothetical protein